MAETKVKTAPYGSWKSPISSAVVCKGSITYQEIHSDRKCPGIVYWSELHPSDEGRVILFSRALHETAPTRWTPKGFSCQSKVHEYGGGAFFIYNSIVYFVNDSNQQFYCQKSPNDAPTLVTPGTDGHRYADGEFSPHHNKFVCILEDHTVVEAKGEPDTSIVLVDPNKREQISLVSGSDFYCSPKVSSDGSQLLWMEWNHPNMPWDNTKICVINLLGDGTDSSTLQCVYQRDRVNVQHPRWGSDGNIFFISDETNWWNIYLWQKETQEAKNLHPKMHDFGEPHWRFGRNCFDVSSSGSHIIAKNDKGLLLLDIRSGAVKEIDTGDHILDDLNFCQSEKNIFGISYNTTSPSSVVAINIETGVITNLAIASTLDFHSGYLSKPGFITFPTENATTVAHGNFYPPKNQDFEGPSGTCPPLLIKVHGGPTGQAFLSLDLEIQYFTSRGFAVLDVNYRGSTGFGKKYREELYGKWGICDVEDCCSGAKYLADLHLVNPNGLFIDGGSAGGYTTLACLTFRDIFKAGVSHFGISDLELIAKETMKFESRYCCNLVAPYPEEKQTYLDRSPLNHIDKLNSPTAFFHGGLDKVVPPKQAELMYNAIKDKGLPCAYEFFPDEYHGFVKSENRRKALDGELYFFARILGVQPADQGIEIPIENLKN